MTTWPSPADVDKIEAVLCEQGVSFSSRLPIYRGQVERFHERVARAVLSTVEPRVRELREENEWLRAERDELGQLLDKAGWRLNLELGERQWIDPQGVGHTLSSPRSGRTR